MAKSDDWMDRSSRIRDGVKGAGKERNEAMREDRIGGKALSTQ